MIKEADLLIVGAGIVGLTLSLAMAQIGLSVILLEASSLSSLLLNQRRVYAVNGASKTLFNALGVLHPLSPYEKMFVWDSLTQKHIAFDAREAGEAALGYIVEDTLLKKALLQKVQASLNITFLTEVILEDLDCSKSQQTIRSLSGTFKAPCLVAADGAFSWVKKKLAIQEEVKDYEQYALVTWVKTEKNHQKTAYQVFSPQGVLAFLPLENPYESSIVWSTNTLFAKELMNLSDEAFSQTLTCHFQNRLGVIHEAGERFIFPLKRRIPIQLVGESWVLMGDAAHTIHPLAGQGLNLGLQDVSQFQALLQKRVKSSKNPWSYSSLKHYERRRKSEVYGLVNIIEGLKLLFDTRFLSSVRGVGLSACNHLLPLKQLFVSYAMGQNE